MIKDLARLSAVSLAAGLLVSLLQGILPRDFATALYILLMGLAPLLFSILLTGIAAGLHRLIRRRPLPRIRLALWSTWLLGNLLLLLDQHLAR